MVPRDAEYNAHFRQLAQQSRAAIAEEGQGNAGGGHQARDHGDVQKGLEPGEGHEAHHQQGAEPVPGVEGDPEAPENQQGEHQHDDAGSHQAQLLADHGEDAVVVLLGQVQELLAALAQAHAQQAAGADGNEALGDLPAVAPIPLGVEGVPPGVDAVFPVVQDALLHQDHIQGAHQAYAADAQGDQPALDAAHDHQHRAGGEDQNGARQVRLQHHQHADDRQQHPPACIMEEDGGGQHQHTVDARLGDHTGQHRQWRARLALPPLF